MSKKILLALALFWASASQAFAGWPVVSEPVNSAMPLVTISVFNDSGLTLNSGEVVVWDSADSDLATDLSPYVTTTTTVDDPQVAGVIYNPVCNDQTVCEIVVYGPTLVRCNDSADNVTVDTYVGTAGAARYCGDYTSAADKKPLGVALESGGGTDFEYISVFVSTLGGGP